MMKLKQKISTPLGFSILFNAVVLFVSIFVFHPFFEENDDAFLALLSEGAYGAHESHLIYVSTILGKIMTILSSILPMIRWHSIMQYLFLFLSFCMITYLLCERKQGKLYAVLFILILIYLVSCLCPWFEVLLMTLGCRHKCLAKLLNLSHILKFILSFFLFP